MESVDAAGEVRHWNAGVNGVSLHVAEQGPAAGPAVLLLHGFPELWLSWRHQMAALAARGFRALAPDLRGYGDSSAPTDPAAYTILHLVGDAVALLDHLSVPKVFVVGHDVGAQVAWHLSLLRPDRVRAVVALGVPYFPRAPSPATELFAPYGDGFYITQFQEPGRAEKAFARYDVATVLKKFYSLELDLLAAPPGVEVIDFFEASPSPLPWMTDEKLGIGSSPCHGMARVSGCLRSSSRARRTPASSPLEPSDYIESGGFKANVPDLEVAIIEGHHYLQQEQAERVNAEILSFLDRFSEN